MKKVIGLAILVLVNLNLSAQIKSDDFGQIVLNAYFPNDMPYFELDKVRIGAYREVTVAYAKNQPKSVTYNNIYWR